MSRVLLIDDDAGLLEVLGLAIEDAGHVVVRAGDGDVGWRALQHGGVDVVVSDVNLPGLDGFSLCKRARALGMSVPIVLLTSRDSDIDEALGLELGADDYVTKPFSTRVLLARVQALLRRDALRLVQAASLSSSSGSLLSGAMSPSLVATTEMLMVDHLTIDTERMAVAWKGTEITVTVTELKLLELLARRPGVVQSRAQLLDRLRGDDTVVADRLIDTYVRRLRRKLEVVDAGFDAIETLVGAGYRWRRSER